MRPWSPRLPILVGCASVARPPGGPEDHAPPEIVSISIDTNATNVTAGKIEVIFDEVISEHPTGGGSSLQGAPTLENVVLISPRTGATNVSWHRDRITIEPKGGFKANTTYRITLLPGIADIRGNVRQGNRCPSSSAPERPFPPFSILGQVFDWQASASRALTIVEAIANAGTKDSLTYIAIADSTGQFDVGPLGPGKYLVRGFIDADNSQAIGPLEKWDTVTVEVTDHRPVVELLAIQRDTAPAGVQRVEVMDSTWLRVTLDKPFDPRTTLQPAFVILKRADSTEVPIAAVMTEARGDREDRAPPDSTARPAAPPTADLDTVSRHVRRRPSRRVPPPERVDRRPSRAGRGAQARRADTSSPSAASATSSAAPERRATSSAFPSRRRQAPKPPTRNSPMTDSRRALPSVGALLQTTGRVRAARARAARTRRRSGARHDRSGASRSALDSGRRSRVDRGRRARARRESAIVAPPGAQRNGRHSAHQPRTRAARRCGDRRGGARRQRLHQSRVRHRKRANAARDTSTAPRCSRS